MKTAFSRPAAGSDSRIARGLTGHGVRILAYHGFCDGDEARFQPMLFMRAQTFRAHAAAARIGSPCHFAGRGGAAARRPHIEPGLAVVTIDDGWHGIHEHAWPVLRELDLPATVYVQLLRTMPAAGSERVRALPRLAIAAPGGRAGRLAPVSQGGRRLRIAPPGTCLPTACPGMRMRSSRRRSVLLHALSPRGSRSTSSPCSRGEPFTSCRPLSSASSPRRAWHWSCILTVTGFRRSTARHAWRRSSATVAFSQTSPARGRRISVIRAANTVCIRKRGCAVEG